MPRHVKQAVILDHTVKGQYHTTKYHVTVIILVERFAEFRLTVAITIKG